MTNYLSLDFFYAFLLYFANTPFLVAVLAISYFCVDRTKFAFMAIYMSLAMIINQWLKSQFQIPLNPELLSPGWAFPSGHTHMNIIFWGILIMLTRKLWLIPLALIALISSFFGMVHFRFHTWDDIYGGICFGIATLMIFYLLYRRLQNNLTLFGFLCLTTYALLYFAALPEMPIGYYTWLWNGFGIICAVIFVHLISNSLKGALDIHVKQLGIFYSIFAILIGYLLNSFIPNTKDYFFSFLRGFFIVSTLLVSAPIIGNMVLSNLKIAKNYKDLSRKKRT